MRNPCGAKTRNGGTCPNPPVNGAKRCRMHGGKTDKAEARAQAERALKTLGEVSDEKFDPAQALVRLCATKAAEVEWLRSMVTRVDADPSPAGGSADGQSPLVWSQTSHETGTGPEGPIDKSTWQAAPNVWWKLLREAEDQLARYTTAALRAGVERRQIELQEAQALQIAQAIHRILDQLQLTQEQARRVPDVVPGVLRQLPTEPTTQEGTA